MLEAFGDGVWQAEGQEPLSAEAALLRYAVGETTNFNFLYLTKDITVFFNLAVIILYKFLYTL